MKHHQFHSELTCDEVWYRLNILLQSFAVCGAKRYEVRGELTDWGCYLWLRNSDGYGGTPVPLRLWTEEGQSPGCVITGSFLPAGRELWGLLIGGVGLCLEFFLTELVCGVPFSRALMTGLWVGCAAAAVLYLLTFGIIRFFPESGRENCFNGFRNICSFWSRMAFCFQMLRPSGRSG